MVTLHPSTILPFIQTQGYLIIFIIMFIEGPIITFVAAFASSLGYFNPGFILLLSFLGNFLPDLICYAIGHFARRQILDKGLVRFGLTKNKVELIKKKINLHSGKMMTIIKVVPSLPLPGLIIAGTVVPFPRFVFLSFTITLIYSCFFFFLGIFAGSAYTTIMHYFKFGEIVAVILVVLMVVISFLVGNKLKKSIKF